MVRCYGWLWILNVFSSKAFFKIIVTINMQPMSQGLWIQFIVMAKIKVNTTTILSQLAINILLCTSVFACKMFMIALFASSSITSSPPIFWII